MKTNKKLAINMIASMITLFLSFLINFFLSKYIVTSIGVEAYGFVSLATSMTNYATIITTALNSVAGRFITISYHRKDQSEANQYFNSVLYANFILAFLFTVIGTLVIWNLEKLIHIPLELISSVKNLFAFTFISFMLSIVGTVFTVATFITNQLYLSSIVNTISNLLKILFFYLFFSVLPISVAIVGVVSLLCTAFVFISNVYFTKKLVPEFHVSMRDFSLEKVKILFTSGIWNSVSNISQTLSNGLDLLVSNLFVSPKAMGQLAIAQTLENILNMVVSNLTYIFSPQLTYYYAKNDIKNVLQELKLSLLMTASFANIPFCILIAFGRDLIELWMPTENATTIYILFILTTFAFLNSPAISGLYNVFTITNQLKVNSMFWLGVSILNISIVFILLHNTTLGVLAVAGVSSITGLIANFTFIPIYAAKCLNQKIWIFYPTILRYLIVTIIMGTAFVGIRFMLHDIEGWLSLILLTILSGMLGLMINYFLLYTNKERERLKAIIMKKIMKKGENI